MNWALIAPTVVGVAVTIVGIVMGFYGFPKIVDNQITENVVLKNDTDQFDRFVTLPIPLDFKVYIFNVTNPEEANKGEKPIVQELGPYVYKQSRHKTNITWNGNQISYYEHSNFAFEDKASGKFNQTDEVTVLNPALNSAIQLLELAKPIGSYLLEKLSETIPLAFNTNDIFLTIPVKDFLFDGYKICQIDKIKRNNNLTLRVKVDVLIACIGLYAMPTKNIKIHNDTVDGKELIFTFLNHKNVTHNGRFTINSGADEISKLGWIEKWEEKSYLQYWKGGDKSPCNEVKGRDAVIYKPFLTTDDVLTVYNTDICRTVNLHHDKDREFRDVTGSEFILTKDNLETISENQCYCLNVTKGSNPDSGCFKKGILELFTCYNAPILLSFPHFLWADEDYKNSVDGLKPEIDKHKTSALLELKTGTPLGGSKRVQFNMFVRSVEGVTILDGYKEKTKIVPMLWLDEGFEINDELYDVLYDSYIAKTHLVTGLTWGIVALGIVIIAITVVVFFIRKKKAANK